MGTVTHTRLGFDDLTGWAADDHYAALVVFRNTCDVADDARLQELAKVDATDPRGFFETYFEPVLIRDGAPMLFTGYFEPELTGSRQRSEAFPHPVLALPSDLRSDTPYLTRREIEQDMALAESDLALAWLADPLDLFFLQVQGSGRIRLAEGGVMRVGFAARNGHPYTSIGKLLIARGTVAGNAISADAIREWVHANGAAGRALLWENESYVFFREITDVPADQGPLGAMNRSVTAGRSIAVDPQFTPLGAPVWIEKSGADPINRLMVAQDTGAAIKGAQRADIFFGTGDAAGQQAGSVSDPGRMIVLTPKGAA